jgi:hypothetical protein
MCSLVAWDILGDIPEQRALGFAQDLRVSVLADAAGRNKRAHGDRARSDGGFDLQVRVVHLE